MFSKFGVFRFFLEGEQDVLVLEKIAVKLQHHSGMVSGVTGTSSGPNSNHQQPSQIPIQYRYSIMAGTSEKMLDYLLETRLDANADLVGGNLMIFGSFDANFELSKVLNVQIRSLRISC